LAGLAGLAANAAPRAFDQRTHACVPVFVELSGAPRGYGLAYVAQIEIALNFLQAETFRAMSATRDSVASSNALTCRV
jgi:hypothetical protein